MKRSWSLTDPFTIALASGVVAGLFSLAPLAYNYLTSPRYVLSYTATGSPTLKTAAEFKRIHLLEVINEGSNAVNEVFAQIALPSGSIDEVSIEASPGISVQENTSALESQISVDSLNPGEKVLIASMMSTPTYVVFPNIAVRAPGARAEQRSLSKDPRTDFIDYLLPMLAAVVVVTGMVFYSHKRDQSQEHEIMQDRDRQADISSYILDKIDFSDLADKIRFAGNDVTYRMVCDLVFAIPANSSNEHEKRRLLTALSCMLLIDHMNDFSRNNIRRAITLLAGNNTLLEVDRIVAKRKRTSEPSTLSDEIDAVVAENGLVAS